jgi:hypothetical protein
MGITIESATEDYWGDLEEDSCSHMVKKYISKDRFQQLDRYIRATKPRPQDDNSSKSTFNRVNDLSEHLQILCRKLYNPGAHLDNSTLHGKGQRDSQYSIKTNT